MKKDIAQYLALPVVAMLAIACSKSANQNTVPVAHAVQTEDEGGMNGGGGDECEAEFKVIRDDLKLWISQGGAAGLNLPAALTGAQYSDVMLTEIGKTRISCVSKGDFGFPVVVGATPKTCRWDKTTSASRITCDLEKLRATELSEKYNLIHHEFASLAGLERPNVDDSNYEISNQISGFLTQELVKKLAVKTAVKDGDAYIVYEKADNGDLNKTIYLKGPKIVGWEVVRSWNGYTWLNFSGAPYGELDTRVCFVQSSANGLRRRQSYIGVAFTDDDASKALTAIVKDDTGRLPTNIVCMSRPNFNAKYPSDIEQFFQQIDP